MRFVPSKSVAQQDIQSLHRIRSQAVAIGTAHANQIRGLLMENGLIIPQGISSIRKSIPLVLEDAGNKLTSMFRELLNNLYEEMVHLDARIKTQENTLESLCAQNEDCQRLLSIPGLGILAQQHWWPPLVISVHLKMAVNRLIRDLIKNNSVND
ncbi:hypothetical protein [Neptunomonas qingdaonensis]|uniref:Transposase n=1 Tax=Neptunomonas qingdaonensis TaxID=1045558 RepID=A0A1I2TVT6_9GAMM|nr:hypothetical protein [Neptunomonas qingdaonensis]SFG66431.1 hypothetical protein SAMN05216175_110148 [Neptunomonas qingdaonensis]